MKVMLIGYMANNLTNEKSSTIVNSFCFIMTQSHFNQPITKLCTTENSFICSKSVPENTASKYEWIKQDKGVRATQIATP